MPFGMKDSTAAFQRFFHGNVRYLEGCGVVPTSTKGDTFVYFYQMKRIKSLFDGLKWGQALSKSCEDCYSTSTREFSLIKKHKGFVNHQCCVLSKPCNHWYNWFSEICSLKSRGKRKFQIYLGPSRQGYCDLGGRYPSYRTLHWTWRTTSPFAVVRA